MIISFAWAISAFHWCRILNICELTARAQRVISCTYKSNCIQILPMPYRFLNTSYCSTSGACWLLADFSIPEHGTLTETFSLVATAATQLSVTHIHMTEMMGNQCVPPASISSLAPHRNTQVALCAAHQTLNCSCTVPQVYGRYANCTDNNVKNLHIAKKQCIVHHTCVFLFFCSNHHMIYVQRSIHAWLLGRDWTRYSKTTLLAVTI